MKQHITVEQLSELTETGRAKLIRWWKPQYGDLIFYKDYILSVFDSDEYTIYVYDLEFVGRKDCYPCLSIGQMIEYLGEDWYYMFFSPDCHDDGSTLFVSYDGEFCDTLWQVVKEDLEK